MGWLPWPLIPKRQWPAVKFKEKRAITLEEHQRIIAAEVNPERKALYHDQQVNLTTPKKLFVRIGS